MLGFSSFFIGSTLRNRANKWNESSCENYCENLVDQILVIWMLWSFFTIVTIFYLVNKMKTIISAETWRYLQENILIWKSESFEVDNTSSFIFSEHVMSVIYLS